MTTAQKMSLLWGVTTLIYLVISYFTQAWSYTWIIFVVAGIATKFMVPGQKK